MIPPHVYGLCHETQTVTSETACDPTDAIENIIDRLYNSDKKHGSYTIYGSDPPDALDPLEVAFQCGRWGKERPSDLFLQAFSHSISCLDRDPMAGMISPPLMGSHGFLPLSIIAPLVDVIRHCANLIVRAKREVFFVTCVWTPSAAQRMIRDALVELSKRAGLRRERVTVNIIFDQPSAWHTVESHQIIRPAALASRHIQLPRPDEIPNLDIEVLSVHSVVLGTLHAKFCIVDREIATVMSNNVEDNANMEMLIHLEGKIVASIYDSALITWKKAFGRTQSSANEAIEVNGAQKATTLQDLPRIYTDKEIREEISQANSLYEAKGDESVLQAVNRQLNVASKTPVSASGPEITGKGLAPYIQTMTPNPVPMAVVSRPAYGGLDSGNINVPQNEAWLSLVRHAKKSIFIQTPDLNAEPLLQALSQALTRGVEVTYFVCFGYNDAGEMIIGQGGTNEQAAQRLITSLPPDGHERGLLHIYHYVAKDQDHPIHHSFRARDCHVKLLIVDDTVGVHGSGNQDTQSWCHSQELNVMVDSPEICARWRDGIEQNQNTLAFGRVHVDGVWRDAEGMPGEGYSGDPGIVSGLFRGVGGMIKKMSRQ